MCFLLDFFYDFKSIKRTLGLWYHYYIIVGLLLSKVGIRVGINSSSQVFYQIMLNKAMSGKNRVFLRIEATNVNLVSWILL